MSGTDPADDAEKIRLKRLARLGGGSAGPSRTSTPSSDTSAEGVASSTTPTTPAGPSTSTQTARPASALSRLNNSTPVASTSSAATNSVKKATVASSSSSTPTSTTVKAPAPTKPTVRATSTYTTGSNASPGSSSTTPLGRQTQVRSPVVLAPTMKYKEWEDEKVGQILGVTLSKQQAEQSDYRRCYLKSLEQELQSESSSPGGTVATSIDIADTLMIARLSIDPGVLSDDPDMMAVLAGLPQNETVFEYLTGCWKRMYGASRELSKLGYTKEEKQQWSGTFDKLKELIISYCGHTLEDPSMFPQPSNKPLGPAEFLPILLSSSTITRTSNNLDPLTASSSNNTSNSTTTSKSKPALDQTDLQPFLTDLATRFSGDGLDGVLEAMLSFLFQEFFKISPPPDLLGNEWREFLGAITALCKVGPIAAMLPKLSVWLQPSAAPEQMEWFSLLGPLTRLSVFPREFPNIWKTYFDKQEERRKGDIESNQDTLRGTLTMLQDNLFVVYNAIIRASPDSREAVMNFFGTVLAKNKKRSGMRVDHRTVASDGYMINLQTVLLRLFEPLLDVNFSKIDRIDVNYFKVSQRLDIKEETKIRGTQEESNEYYSPKDGMDVDSATPPNFPTDLFFLLNAFQHLSVNKTISNRHRGDKNIRETKKELKRVEADRPNWGEGTPAAAQGEALVKKLKTDIDVLKASVSAYDTQLLSPDLISRNVAFLNFTMTWLVRLVDPTHQYPKVMIKLPLPAEAPLNFRMLPEYLIENIAEYMEFVVQYGKPETLDNATKDVMITFFLTFMEPNYVNNPFLKAKFMTMLNFGVQPHGYFRKGILHQQLSYHPLATERLMPTLVRFFIDVEATGGHTQFWDKFNMRRDIDGILKALWDNPLHREAFVKARHDDFELFVRFANMLMSDTTFHLDESLTGLAKIHNIRSEMARTEEWQAKPEAERKDLESQLSQAEGGTPFHTQLGLSHIQLIQELTATTKEPFMTSEIVGRLANSLDETVNNLVGPRMQDLKVTDPDRFSFKPKDLLAGISQIYINLSQEKDFVRAVASDGRGYSKEVFEKLARILKNRAIMVDAEIQQILTFLAQVEEAKASIAIEDEREIPDEFLDPLMSTLMKNPVILPLSRISIDEGTIRTALLSKAVDPFNNTPLKIEDCIPDVELKAKIDAWLKETSSKPAEDVDMDVANL